MLVQGGSAIDAVSPWNHLGGVAAEVDRSHILDHCQLPLRRYHLCLPFRYWWRRVRPVSVLSSGRVNSTGFAYAGYRVRSVGQNGDISYNMVPLSRDLFLQEDY